MTRPAAVLVLVVWVVVPFWRIATFESVNVQNDAFASDLLHDRLPCRAFVGASIARGEIPLWIPTIYTGFPALAEVEIGALYPTNLLLFGVLDPHRAIAWAQILPLVLAGVGAFLLARELGIGNAGSLLAGGAFALSGFLVVHLRQLNMVDASAWIPWVFLLLDRLARGRDGRPALGLAVVWGLQILAGHPQISFFTGLVGVVFFAGRLAGGGRVLRGSTRAAAAIGLGTLLAAAQWLPTAELASLGHRAGGLSFEAATRYAADPRALWTFLLPNLYGTVEGGDYALAGLPWEQYGYVGLATALLATWGLVTALRDGRAQLLAGIAIVSAVLALGPASPAFRWAYESLPGMDLFRFPTRFLVFTDLAVVLLAGIGLDGLLRRVPDRRRTVVAGVVLAVTAADLWIHQMARVPLAPFETWTAEPETVRFLGKYAEGAGEPVRYHSLEPAGVHRVRHLEAVRSSSVGPYLRHRAMLQPSSNVLWAAGGSAGLETPDGYVNLVPDAYEAVWGSEKAPGLVVPSGTRLPDGAFRITPRVTTLLRLFNVHHVLSAWPIASPGLREVAVTSEGVGIHEVLDPLPRAFVVERTWMAASDSEGLERLSDPEFDPEREAIVYEDLRLPAGSRASREVRVIARQGSRLDLEATLEAPGLLVVSEGYYPGWRVTVNGKPAALHRVNSMMRGVILDAGHHAVVFELRSTAVRLGGLLSLGGLLGIALFARRIDP